MLVPQLPLRTNNFWAELQQIRDFLEHFFSFFLQYHFIQTLLKVHFDASILQSSQVTRLCQGAKVTGFHVHVHKVNRAAL